MSVHAFIQAPFFRSLATTSISLPLTSPIQRTYRTVRPRPTLQPPLQSPTASINSNNDDENGAPRKYDPVEDGVSLPVVSAAEIEVQASWLEIEVRSWLDGEWQEETAWASHREIAHQTSRAYARLRAEGMHDCTSLLLAIGEQLEGLDFSATYTGPWNVANKTADLLLRRFIPDRFAEDNGGSDDNRRGGDGGGGEDSGGAKTVVEDGGSSRHVPTPDHVAYVAVRQAEADAKARNQAWSVYEGDGGGVEVDDEVQQRRPASPNLADEFERYRFLQMVLEGTAIKPLIDGAVAVAMGFDYDMKTGAWNGANVTDTHFRTFGNDPPDVLGDEQSPEWTDTLLYLHSQLGLDKDEDGKIAAGLQIVLETLHGVEMTRIQQQDAGDHAFNKRAAVVKWLHLRGGF